MELFKTKDPQFKQLLETFIVFLKVKFCKDYVVRNYRKALAKIDLYMQEHAINGYTSEIGICYCEQYVRRHQTAKSRAAAIWIAVGILNDFFLGKEY